MEDRSRCSGRAGGRNTARLEETLPDAVQSEVERWVKEGERSQASVDDAYEVMQRVLRDFGATAEDIVRLDRDVDRIAREVLATSARKRRLDSAAGKRLDADTADACDKIARAFCRSLVNDETWTILLDHATTREIHRRLLDRDAQEVATEDQAALRLHEDVSRYLRVLIGDLSHDVWPTLRDEPPLSVVDLERTLTVEVTAAPAAAPGATPTSSPGPASSDHVADTSRHLVVVAGPGAGKTWWAKRQARRAATTALQQLSAGATVSDVEIPLFVTCEAFLTHPGDPRAAAIVPALSRRTDLGSGVVKRLTQHLQARDTGILLILDSLDEATTGPRDIKTALIAEWRTIVTTRPAAWHDQWRTTDPAQPVVHARLQDLTYPDDITAYATAWFNGDEVSSLTALRRLSPCSPRLGRTRRPARCPPSRCS